MIKVDVGSISIDQAAVTALNDDNGLVGMAMATAGDRTVDRAKAALRSAGRVETGRLVNSIRAVQTHTDKEVRSQIGSDVPYAIYQFAGTRYITAAPALREALAQLSVDDFVPT